MNVLRCEPTDRAHDALGAPDAPDAPSAPNALVARSRSRP